MGRHRRGSSFPWTPYNLRGLQLHLDAADLSAGAVTTWTDRKNGYTFTQATAGLRPVAHATTLPNSQPALRSTWATSSAAYDGQMLASTDAALRALVTPGTKAWTIHVVARIDSVANDNGGEQDYYVPWAFQNVDATRWLVGDWALTDPLVNDYMGHYFRGDLHPDASGSGSAGWQYNSTPPFPLSGSSTGTHLFTWQWDGATMKPYVDGSLGVPSVGNNTTLSRYALSNQAWTFMGLGYTYLDGTGEPQMASTGAVYMQSEAVSAGDLSRLAAYVARRWQ
jgi:hypothetical protein